MVQWLVFGFVFLLSGCGSGASSQTSPQSVLVSSSSEVSSSSGNHSTFRPKRTFSTDVLLFAGDGTWPAEVSALESILSTHLASYQKVSSAEMNALSLDEMSQFGMMIFPGGSGGTQAGGLSLAAHLRIREAVQSRGVSYLGFCAGAFIAVAPQPAPGARASYGLGVVNGAVLDYYELENQGVTAAMTLLQFADGSTKNVLWYGGPVTPEVPGGVVARYPNGDASISELWSGNALVILVGGHPAATSGVLSSLGLSSSGGTHWDLVWQLIRAALDQKPLPAFSS